MLNHVLHEPMSLIRPAEQSCEERRLKRLSAVLTEPLKLVRRPTYAHGGRRWSWVQEVGDSRGVGATIF